MSARTVSLPSFVAALALTAGCSSFSATIVQTDAGAGAAAVGGHSSAGGSGTARIGQTATAGSSAVTTAGAGGASFVLTAESTGGSVNLGGAKSGGTGTTSVGGVTNSMGGASSLGGSSFGTDTSSTAGNSTAPDTVAPTLSTFTPGAVANPTDVLTATFSEAVNCATITSSSFVVQHAVSTAAVAGTLNCAGATATFTPSTRMSFNATYSAKFTGAIKDLAGNTIANAPLAKTFQVREGIWDSVSQALDVTADGAGPVVTISDTGDAMVLWGRANVNDQTLFAARWVASSASWTGAYAVQTNAGETTKGFQVGADGQGNYIAVWAQGVNAFDTPYQLYSSRFVSGLGWSTPVKVSTDTVNSTGTTRLAVQPNGDAVVLWIQSHVAFSGSTDVFGCASRYTASSDTWTVPTRFASNVQSCSVALNSSGLAVGLYSSTTSPNMYAFTWPSGGPIGESSPIEANTATDTLGYSMFGTVRADAKGDFIAIWQRPHGGDHQHWWNLFTATGGWGTADVAAYTNHNGSSNAGRAALAVNASGRAVSIWQEWNTTNLAVISAGQRLPGAATWGLDSVISDATSFSYSPHLGVSEDDGLRVANDSTGNALAVWHDSDNPSHVWYGRYIATSSPAAWGAPTQLSSTNASRYGDLAMHPSGMAIAVWEETDTTGNHVYSKSFR